MLKPAVKAPHRPLRRPGGKIWVGSAQYGLGSEIRDDTGAIWRLLELLDGTRSRGAAVLALTAEFDIAECNADNLVDTIIEAGWVEDADGHSQTLTARELDRYSRNRDYFAWVDMRPRHHPYALQERLKASMVTVLGLGGTGSAVAMGLAAAGVGTLKCADFDRVELSNLNRQFLYTEGDVGRHKVEAAAARLRSVNSDVDISVVERRIESVADIVGLVDGSDLFVLCADKPAAIVNWANAAALELNIPWLSGAYNGPMLSVGTYLPGKTGCYECLLLAEGDRTAALGIDDVIAQRVQPTFNAVIAPTAQIAGNFAVLEALNVLLGLPTQTAGRQFHQNFIDFQHSYFIEAPPRPDCPACGTTADD